MSFYRTTSTIESIPFPPKKEFVYCQMPNLDNQKGTYEVQSLLLAILLAVFDW